MILPFIEFWYQHLEHDYERELDKMFNEKGKKKV